MKNKKIIYAIIGIVILISMVVIIAIISNKPMPIDHTPKEATSILEELKKKYSDKKYLKLTGGEMLNEDTCFNKYSFINNNSIYIFNPEKLDIGEFNYKKVYDVDKNIKVINIVNNTNKTDGFATAGFVLSLVSFFCCGFTSVIALIFSIVGLVNCNKNGTNGKGLAISGIVISTILIFVPGVLYIITNVLGYATALY